LGYAPFFGEKYKLAVELCFSFSIWAVLSNTLYNLESCLYTSGLQLQVISIACIIWPSYAMILKSRLHQPRVRKAKSYLNMFILQLFMA
jgi:hypothetical protein